MVPGVRIRPLQSLLVIPVTYYINWAMQNPRHRRQLFGTSSHIHTSINTLNIYALSNVPFALHVYDLYCSALYDLYCIGVPQNPYKKKNKPKVHISLYSISFFFCIMLSYWQLNSVKVVCN